MPTPLLKALIKEKRLPYRYKLFLNKYISSKFYNPNSKEHWNEKLGNMKNSVWRYDVYKEMEPYLSVHDKFSLLDVGCALGDGCIYLKNQFPHGDIEGCDFSERGIEKAKKKSDQVNFFVLDILKDKIPKKYDYITFVSVLEHFNKPKKIIKKALKNTNNLIIDCPYATHISYDKHDEHKYAFNEKTLNDFKAKTKIYYTKDNTKRILYKISNVGKKV